MTVAIDISNLSKEYRLGLIGYGTLREDIQSWWARLRGREDPNRPLQVSQQSRPHGSQSILALNDVSLQVNEGEIVGLIGGNGAGKTTLLKIITRLTAPTKGAIRLKGRVAALLAVGTGFHPELTGRENVFLNGAVLGMTRAEIRKRFDAIVDFSGVEKFIDTPVKRYSSGMNVRLGFAVAAHLEPDIMLVDEVLAVGDVEFQQKCLGKMEDIGGHGRTILFVSHNMSAITNLCRRTVLLHEGRVVGDGNTQSVVAQYLERSLDRPDTQSQADGEVVQILTVELKDAQERPTREIRPGESLTIEIHFHSHERVERPNFWLGIYGRFGPAVAADMHLDGRRPTHIEGNGVIRCTFPSLPLLPSFYTVHLGVRDRTGKRLLTKSKECAFLQVVGRLSAYGFLGEQAEELAKKGFAPIVPYEWHLPDGTRSKVGIEADTNAY